MTIVIRNLGIQTYETVWQDMQQFTQSRTEQTLDEMWYLEHNPVYTLGLNGKIEHLLNPANIPVVHSDRGGQVTYHGPGQLIVYTLIDLKRRNLGIRHLVTVLEQAMIAVLAQFAITAIAKPEAPGVYVNNRKIGSIGIRVKKNCSYHGLSFNNQMDLTPFTHINPCGFKGLQMAQMADFGIKISTDDLALRVTQAINCQL